MECPKCKFENPDGHKFCGECGSELVTDTSLIQPRPVPEPERKHVTALFCDLTGYTSMTEKLDPEEVKEITGRIFNEVKQVISKYEGFIERVIGDGVLAFFGVPRAHEDDPIRAIHAAREIHELVKSLSPQYEARIGAPLSMHSGINTGLVVTADVDEKSGTHGVAGDAINVASRLSDLAKPNEILVGQETYVRAEGGFSFEDLGLRKVKGKADPIRIYKVLSPMSQRARIRLNRQVSSEMVGRDQDLAKLELQVLKAVNGEGSVVNVIGEAGIGKSRLIAELKKRDVMKRVTLLEGRAISIGKNLSFHPIIDLLKQWSSIAEEDDEPVTRDKLEKAIRRACGDETDEVFPFVATMMGIKLTGRHAERVKGIEGEGLEKLIVKNVRELVIKGSELRPSVIVMEDLHWADTSSIELLESLYRLAEKHKLVFINVFRPGYFESDDGAIAGVGERLPVYYVEIQIQPLDRNDSEMLIDNMLEIKGLPYALKNQIVNRAGGNPFFIEEVVRSLIDEGAVVRSNGGFEITDRIEKIVIPPTINDVLMARIDRLEEQTRELVKVASVIGRSFFDRIIKDVADSIGDVDDRLAYLKNVQLIGDRIRMQELEYLFKHALAQEAAYESTLIQQRKALHLKVAQSIENSFRNRLHEFYGMLAYHYSRGEDLEKAEEYMTKAGEEALRSSASSEALNYFQEALELYLVKYGDTADSQKIASFEKNIAIALLNKSQWADAVEYLDRVFEHWGTPLPRTGAIAFLRLIRDLLVMLKVLYLSPPHSRKIPAERDNEIMELNFGMALALNYVDNIREFLIVMAMLRRTTKYDISKISNGSTYWAFGSAVFSAAGLSFKLSNRLLDFSQRFDVAGDTWGRIIYSCMSTVNFHWQGTWSKISEPDGDLLNSAIRIGYLAYSTTYLWSFGMVREEQGAFEDPIEAAEMLLDIAETYDYSLADLYARYVTAGLFIKTRATLDALQEAEKGLSNSRKGGTKLQEIIFLGLRAEAQILLGDLERAEESTAEAKDIYCKQRIVMPAYVAPNVTADFEVGINRFEQLTRSQDSSSSAHIRKQTYIAGKAAVRLSRKYAPCRTKILQLMGEYYWLINKQSKAMKWWDKAMKEGERLGARPDLSRTYFEVGKHLLKPESKYKHLNGIDANGYLEKAGILFEEMGLERDLEDLERARMEL